MPHNRAIHEYDGTVSDADVEQHYPADGRPPLLLELIKSNPDGRALVGDSSFSELVGAMHREFPDFSVPACEEILDWQREQGLLANASSPRRTFSGAQWQSAFIRILEYIFNHPSLPDIYAAVYIWDQPALDDILGHLNPAEFAARLGVSRQAINDPVLKAQKQFKLKPRRGQRGHDARANMRTARMKQLKKSAVNR